MKLSRGVRSHRAFDPRAVGRLECGAWVAYYQRRWPKFLVCAIALTRHVFALPWPATLRGAWLVLNANRLWAPFPDNRPDAARREMERFYALVKAHHHQPFDPARAAALEVEWWRVHREHQHADDGGDDHRLVDALAALYAYVYDVSAEAVRLAAQQRAEAMRHSDRWVGEGCDPGSALIALERAALVRSYAGLLAAVYHE
jgi:hypothetical protein